MAAMLVVLNARVWTGDPAHPVAEALVVRGERIAAVGTTAGLRRHATRQATRGGKARPRVIDAGGHFLAPGFIDAHVHLLAGGLRLAGVQLRGARTREEFVRRVAAFAATVPEGTWITGGDWDHEAWGGPLPARDWIDGVTPKHPVLLSRLDGHMALANSAAMSAAGLDPNTATVAGGAIERDASGGLSGLLRDNAVALVGRAVPPASPDQQDLALDAASRYLARLGVTSVHHMGDFDDLEAFSRANRAGRLSTRIYAAVPLPRWAELRDRMASGGASARGDDWLRTGAVKGYVDGSLGARTAAFESPFTDVPSDRGLLVNTEADLYEWISQADAVGLHVIVHAIGDRANRLLLDIYERVTRENGQRDRRFRIEHAQHLSPADVPRFKALGVIASMQPYHAIDDGRWAERVIGPERARTSYAFRSLLDAGARLAFGSDWFVAPPNPLEGLYAAVTRRTLDEAHPEGWVPEQRISAEESLRAYTIDAAFAGFDEHRTGSLSPGKLADFVMLDRSPFDVAPETLRDIRVVATFVGGRAAYER